MVGTNKSSEQLAAIADRILLEVDTDNDGLINFEEFKIVSYVSLVVITLWYLASYFYKGLSPSTPSF